MRRGEWILWTLVLVAGIVGFVSAITVAGDRGWWHFVAPVSGAAIGAGLGQVIRGWWHARHDQTSSRADADR